jgi:hypothetical protein
MDHRKLTGLMYSAVLALFALVNFVMLIVTPELSRFRSIPMFADAPGMPVITVTLLAGVAAVLLARNAFSAKTK